MSSNKRPCASRVLTAAVLTHERAACTCRFRLPLFSMNVNGMEVQLLASEAAEIRRVVEAFCLETLSSVRCAPPCVMCCIAQILTACR